MILKLLDVLLVIGGPLLQFGLKLIPLLYQWKLLKTEAEVREQERRFKEAIVQAEARAKDPDNVKQQYDRAKQAAKDAWNKQKGGSQ